MFSRIFSKSLVLAVVALALPCLARAAEIEKYLPSDSHMVLSANTRQAIASPLFKKYFLADVQTWLKTNPKAMALFLVGLDPLRDIHRVTVAGPSLINFMEQWTVVVRGQFDLGRITLGADLAAKVDPAGLAIHKIEDVRLYEVRDKKQGTSLYAAFLDKEVLVASPSRERVEEAILKSLGKQLAGLFRELGALIRAQDDQKSLWLAGLPLRSPDKRPPRHPRLRPLASMQAFTGTIHLTEVAQVRLHIQTSDPRANGPILTSLAGLREGAALAIQSNPQYGLSGPALLGILRTLRFTQDERGVFAQADIPGEMIEKWIQERKLNGPGKAEPLPPPQPEPKPNPPPARLPRLRGARSTINGR